MKNKIAFLLLILLIFTIQCGKETPENTEASKIAQKAEEALEYCKNNGMNTDFCILIDLGKHSGLKRFYVYDFNAGEISHSFLTSHGCGTNPWGYDQSKDNPQFSNTMNSHMSSLGKYKIGERGYSNWGVHKKYLLHGLEESNSNALRRVIVLHSWEYIADEESYPYGTPEGWGCPAISNNSFTILDPLLKNTSQPTLMWIYQ